MEDFFAIKCRNCGGPMYSHQATRSFECAYCGTSEPWEEGAAGQDSIVKFRHQPLQMVNGLIKLPQVSRLEPPKESDWYFFKPYWRNMSLAEWILNEDPATAGEFERATTVSIPCPFCGAAFEGESTQSVFECPSCGNKIGATDLLQPGTFSKYLSIGTGSEYIPDQAIPCRISEQQARANARELVRQHPDLFAGHSIEDAIDNQMVLAYAAVSLADLRIIASYPGKKLQKETLVLFEVLDWIYPKTRMFDLSLMNLLEPWDFSEVAPFDPAMQEGNFRVAAVEAFAKDSVIIDNLALKIAKNDAEEALGLSKKSLRTWTYNVRKHTSGLMLVPIYYFDRPASDGREGEQVRIAVNGQTGRAAAVVFSETRETHVVAPLSSNLHLSGESTVHATPIEIRYVKSPFLHEIVRIGGDGGSGGVPQAETKREGSLREEKVKKQGFFSKIFGK